MWARRSLLISSVLLACSVSGREARQIDGPAPSLALAAVVDRPAPAPMAAPEPELPEEVAVGLVEDEQLCELLQPAEALARMDPAMTEAPWRPAPHTANELPRWITHHTVPRDTVDRLAIRYGVPARLVRRWNGMSARGELKPSEPRDLRIKARRDPPPRQRVEVVAAYGDSWGSIGRRHGVRGHHLRTWNRETIGSSVEPGERVAIWIEPTVYEAMLDDHPADPRMALVPAGGHGLGTPQDGLLVAGVQIPEGEGYMLRYPNSAWGTTWAVRHTVAALDDFHERSGYGGIIEVGTMSRIRGGRIGGHVSHQSGRDLDIRLPSKGVGKFERVDWMATWELVLAFLRTGAVERIFLDTGGQRRLWRSARKAGLGKDEVAELLQYPRGSRSNFGVVRHSPGHQGHIHVRFTCGPAEPECG